MVLKTEDAVQNALKLDGSTFKDRQLKVLPKRHNEPGYNLRGRGGRFPGRGRGFTGRGAVAYPAAGAYRGGRGARGRGAYKGGAAVFHPYY